jgi:glycine cleavage system transcriptional repressor
MQAKAVVTLTGPDRVGIVEEITGALLSLDANVDTSRMARLGGEFAVLMLVSLPAEKTGGLEAGLAHLALQGYKVTVVRTEEQPAAVRTRTVAYRVEVVGADHEGIIHDIAHGLSQLGINIESMETSTSPAPVSGTPLFSLKAVVAVPPELAESDWLSALNEAGHQANVDVTATRLAEDTLPL